MIGFAGIVRLKEAWDDQLEERVQHITDPLQGKEASPVHIESFEWNGHTVGKVSFLTTRLTPIIRENNEWKLVFYGTSFSYEGKEESTQLEAVLEAMDNPKQAAGLLNGGFTLFCFHKPTCTMHVYRDRGGIKPVFYHTNENLTLLSSGLRAIAKCPLFERRSLSMEGLWTNIAYPAPTQPLTCFEHVHVLKRGGELILDRAGQSTSLFWQIPSRSIDHGMSFSEATARVHESLDEAMRIRSAGEHVGSTLSGGVDSAYLTVLAHQHNPKVEAFTFKIKGKAFEAVNEDDVASMTAKKFGIKHHIEAFDHEDFVADMQTLVQLYEQPGLSLGAYYSIAETADKLGYTRIINGLAADELFGGFHYFKHLEYWQWLRLLNPVAELLPPNVHKGIDKFKRIAGARSIDEYYARSFASYLDPELQRLFKRKDIRSLDIQLQCYNPAQADFNDPVSGLMHYMFSNCPNHHLYRFEVFSNHLGITPLYPFLDNRVIETAFQIPSIHKVQGHRRKIVLKKAAEPYVVKPALTEAKRGVGAPVNAWMDNKLKQVTSEKIEALKQRGIFDADHIDKVVMKYPKGYGKKIWKLVMTEMWFEEFID